jgi:hypothetical protein
MYATGVLKNENASRERNILRKRYRQQVRHIKYGENYTWATRGVELTVVCLVRACDIYLIYSLWEGQSKEDQRSRWRKQLSTLTSVGDIPAQSIKVT